MLRLSAIGDTCHALAVVRRLQDNWPDVHITWIIGKTEHRLMGDIANVDFVVFDKSRGRDAYRDVRVALEGEEFDVALCMHASARTNLIVRSIPSKIRIGFDRARAKDFQWLFTNQRIDAAHGEHAMEAMMAFATAIGAEERPLRWDIPLSEPDRAFAAEVAGGSGRVVAISPCSSQRARNFRNWRIDNFAAVIEHLEKRHGARVVLTGGPSELEKEYAEQLAGRSAAVNLAGRTTLKQLAAVIAAADLVICPDSGPAHMATALGTTVVGLYATSNPARTGPYLSQKFTINRYPDAVMRYLGRNVAEIAWGRRVRHPDAMDLVTVDDVVQSIDNFFIDRDI